MTQRIQHRRGTAAQWTTANPVLAAGEFGVETDTGQVKVGDGVTAWSALPYLSKTAVDALDAELAPVAKSGNAADLTGTDTTMAAKVTDPASATRGALNAAYGYVLGPSNGTDDTTWINAILATASGKTVRGQVGQTYRLSAPLMLPPGGNVTLDMTGCTIKGVGVGNFNMLRNDAVNPQRTVSDGAMTSGTTTLTSATAAFTSADVGRYVKVMGAAISGDLLVAKITAVTNGTTVTLDTAASTTVSAKTVNVHNVDRNIQLVGGRWDHLPDSRAWSYAINDHSIVFRFVEWFTIRDMTHTSLGGKYAIHVGACSRGRITGHFYDNYASDGVHVHGPSDSIVIRDISGVTNDDMIAITGRESSVYDPNNYNDVMGPITRLVAENIHKNGGLARIAYVSPGRNGSLTDIKIRNVGGHAISHGVMIEGDVNTRGGTITDLVVENVNTTSDNSASQVMIASADCGRVTLDNLWREQPGSSNHLIEVVGSTFDSLVVRNARMRNSGSGQIMKIAANGAGFQCSFGSLTLADVRYAQAATAYAMQMFGGSIGTLVFRDWEADVTGDASLVALSSGVTVNRLRIRGLRYQNPGISGSIVRAPGGSITLGELQMSEVYSNGAYWLADINQVTNLWLSSVRQASPGGGAITIGTSGQLLVWASNYDAFVPNVVNSGSLRSMTQGFRLDISKITSKSKGDAAYNTNAALSCGVGPVVYTGTAWKSLIDGTTF